MTKKTVVERIFESVGITDENMIQGWVNLEKEELIKFWNNGANAITTYGAENYYNQEYKGIDIRGYFEPVIEIPKGLTKREYFASTVLQGLLTNENAYLRLGIEPATKVAIQYADSLIKELKK